MGKTFDCCRLTKGNLSLFFHWGEPAWPSGEIGCYINRRTSVRVPQLRKCVKIKVAVLGSLSLIVVVSVDVKQH